jgi:N-acetylneuraminic acid mutarotase
MLVHGGLNDGEKTLNDTIFLDFNTLKWNKLDIRGTRSPYLSSHSSEFVLENEKLYNPTYHVYKGSNLIENTNIIKKIEFEGIYVFGGIDEDRNYKNEVFVLRVGRKPCEWTHLKINGNPPLPRANASMNFFQNLNILVIAGGKNDSIKRCIFNDVFVLDLENLYWIKAATYPVQPKERTGHRAAVFNSQLFILGGNNIKKFLSMDFFVLDLDLFSNKYRERDRDRFKEIDMKGKLIDRGKKVDIDGEGNNQM